MRASLEEILSANKIMIIDGSMSTALENLGAELNNDLWTAQTLAEKPDLVKQVHINYFRVGADCGITCSYQATIPGLIKHGYTEHEAEDIIKSSVQVFLEARSQWWEAEGKNSGRSFPLCLGSVGPYGAYLADGSEYTGNYNIDSESLYNFHRRRIELLNEAGADILLFETQPSLEEVMIEAEIAEELEADYWVSFSCKDGEHICKGNKISECAKKLSKGHEYLKMLGVNCTKPEYIVSLISELKKGSDLPVAVYPNSGEVYDPETKTWTHSEGGIDFGSYALLYMRAGAQAVGGCCTTTEKHIMQVWKARERFLSEERGGMI